MFKAIHNSENMIKSFVKILQNRNIVRSLPSHCQVYKETFLVFQAYRSIETGYPRFCVLTVCELNKKLLPWKI